MALSVQQCPNLWPQTRQEEEGIFGRHWSACWLIPWLSLRGSRIFLLTWTQLGRPRRRHQLSEAPFLPASPGVGGMDWEGSLPFASTWVGSSGRDKGEGPSLQVLPGGPAPASSQEVGSGCGTGGGALEPSWPSFPSCPGRLRASALALTSLSILPPRVMLIINL